MLGLSELGHQPTLFDCAGVAPAKLPLHKEVTESDVVFIVLHGGAGENGEVQQALEKAGKPFTGSGSKASAIAMDKPQTKTLARESGIVTPNWIAFPVSDSGSEIMTKILAEFALPLVIKPADGGSTVGLTLVREESEIPAALELLAQHCQQGMAEQYIAGRELTVAVFDGQPFEVVEIKPKSGLYDYHAKYTKGGSEYFCPAAIDSDVRGAIRTQAMEIYNKLNCAGLARVDYILDSHNAPQFLELNTIPGMTDLSLAPMSAQGDGISFTELLQKALESAMN